MLAGAEITHELACFGGITAAHRLGAGYNKLGDFAEDFFRTVLRYEWVSQATMTGTISQGNHEKSAVDGICGLTFQVSPSCLS